MRRVGERGAAEFERISWEEAIEEVAGKLKDIAARGGIGCSCGSKRWSMQVSRGAVDLICADCGGRLRINAATDEDLDKLCCQMKLEIHGR